MDLENEIAQMDALDLEDLRLWYVVQTKTRERGSCPEQSSTPGNRELSPRLGTYEQRQGTMVHRIKPLLSELPFCQIPSWAHYYR